MESRPIDHGEDGQPFAWDQRGKGYDRVVGASTDIGAFEVQGGELIDSIFENGFD